MVGGRNSAGRPSRPRPARRPGRPRALPEPAAGATTRSLLDVGHHVRRQQVRPKLDLDQRRPFRPKRHGRSKVPPRGFGKMGKKIVDCPHYGVDVVLQRFPANASRVLGRPGQEVYLRARFGLPGCMVSVDTTAGPSSDWRSSPREGTGRTVPQSQHTSVPACPAWNRSSCPQVQRMENTITGLYPSVRKLRLPVRTVCYEPRGVDMRPPG